jgi:hypothetical protein
MGGRGSRLRWAWAGLAAAGLGTAWLLRPATPGPVPDTAPPAPARAAVAAPAPSVMAWPPAPVGEATGAAGAAPGPRLDPHTLALRPALRAAFRADAQGRLVHDEALRVQVEKLLALHEPDEARRLLEAETAGLPAPAVAQARELLERFEAWQQAQRQAFAPGVAPLVPEEALAQLQTLQALRASHFGTAAAQAMFGEEDAVTRRLLQLMQQETDTRLSMEERAMRAQVRYDQERAARGPR